MSKNQNCALFSAIKNRDTQLLKKLLLNNVGVNKVNRFNIYPLEFAIKYANSEIINLLLIAGAKMNPNASSFFQHQLKWHQKKHQNQRLKQ